MLAPRLLQSAGALFGLSGVVLGAWGAHGLTAYLGTNDTGAWDTAVLYQLIHALALLVVGVWHQQRSDRWLALAGGAFAIGILCFSGSLYLLMIDGPGWLGPITPIGGMAFIVGWCCVLVAAWVRQR